MITTISILPPVISQAFDSKLLTNPARLRNDETDLWRIFEFIEKKLAKKLRGTPGEKIKYEALKQEFLNLYGQIKAKKENKEAVPENQTEEPFYFFMCVSRSDDEILTRLRYKSR